MLHFLATDDITTSCLTVETSDVPYIVKLASGDLTSWVATAAGLSPAETNQFLLIMNLWCELDWPCVQTLQCNPRVKGPLFMNSQSKKTELFLIVWIKIYCSDGASGWNFVIQCFKILFVVFKPRRFAHMQVTRHLQAVSLFFRAAQFWKKDLIAILWTDIAIAIWFVILEEIIILHHYSYFLLKNILKWLWCDFPRDLYQTMMFFLSL